MNYIHICRPKCFVDVLLFAVLTHGQILSDPGTPGDQNMGPDVTHSKMLLTLN